MTSIVEGLYEKFSFLSRGEHTQELEPILLLAQAIDALPDFSLASDKRSLVVSGSSVPIENPAVGYIAAGLVDYIQKHIRLRAYDGEAPYLNGMTYFQDFVFGGVYLHKEESPLSGSFEKTLSQEISTLLSGLYDKIVSMKTNGLSSDEMDSLRSLEPMTYFCIWFLQRKIRPHMEFLATEFFKAYGPEKLLFTKSGKFQPKVLMPTRTKWDLKGRSDLTIKERNFWLFAPALMADGNNFDEVRTKIRNRWQAYRIYGFLAPALIGSPQITEMVDQGQSIEKPLRTLYGLNGHQMNDLKTLAQECDPWQAACDLHGDGGTPSALIGSFVGAGASAQEWKVLLELVRTVHRKGWGVVKSGSDAARYVHNDMVLLPRFAYFFGAKIPDQEDVSHKDLGSLQDAGLDLQKDLLGPLYRHLGDFLGLADGSNEFDRRKQEIRLKRLLTAERYPFTQNPDLILAFKEARDLRSSIRNAIVGDRTITGFHKDLLELHKFAASITAKRNAILNQELTWPNLFPRWQSPDGKQEIEFLTSTTALVQEGLRMRHCVGSYDTICTRGKTHIAAVRVEGESVATLAIEAEIDRSSNALILENGQFKARFNAAPSVEAHQAVGAFLKDVQAGRIMCNLKETIDFMNEAVKRPVSDSGFYGKSLTLETAEELWPIYRQTLIFSHPEAHTLQDWVRASGIEGAMKRLAKALTALNAEPANEVDRPHEAREQHVERQGPELHSLT